MGSKIGLHDLTNGTMLNLIKPDNTGNIDITLPTENGSLITSEKVDEKIGILSSTIAKIEKPVITAPYNGEVDFLGYITLSDFKASATFSGVHTGTEWELSTSALFTSNIDNKIDTVPNNTWKPTLGAYNSVLYVRARYLSNTTASDWSEVVMFKPKKDIGVDQLTSVIAGNSTTGAFYGELTAANLVENRDYRGPYKIGTTFKANTQVSHNEKLWNAKVDAVDIEPGTDSNTWEEDTRNNLPTGKWLLDVCGVGYGLKDYNNDGYSTSSLSIGALKNNDQGFLKFAKNGKILYVAKKPFVGTIGWNDLAKRNLVYGDRTVRIGSRLYYVRLVTEAEYLDCLVASTNGTLANLATTDLALEEKTWLHDTQTGAVRKAYSGVSTLENIDPKSRVGSYRPVLELIEEGNEPYLNLPNCPAATNENFQYDKFTDTGYFGEVPTTSILSGSALATSIGLTAGSAQHDTAGYLKFYWHGKILYVAKRPFRHTVSWDNIKAANAVFGVDLGGSGKATITANGYTYIVQLLTGAGKAPADDAQYWINSDNFAANVLLEIGKFSQWNELIYRVHQTVVDDVLANQDGLTSSYGYTGGVQIGANWANFNNVDLVIYYTEGGNGTATWTQETSVNATSYRVYRGFFRLAHLSRGTSSSAYDGWRPSLCLS